MAQITLSAVHKRFGEFVAVRDSSFTVGDGEFFVLLGPSGCGKTTTLRMIAGLELPTSGKVLLDGEDVTDKRASQRDIGFVFQLFALYPHMSVRGNIGFPLTCQGVPRKEIARRVEDVARFLRIEGLLDRSVSGLSGGDSQRVSLGRAVVRHAKAFMMDEPLGAMDSEFRRLMCTELRQLHERIGATTVYVTHDQIEAMSMADRIAIMNHGVVDQIGSPQDIYDRPLTMHVAGFIGSPAMNFLRFTGHVHGGEQTIVLDSAEIRVPRLHESRSGELALGVRPEHVRIEAGGGVSGTVVGSEYMGTLQIVTIDTAHGRIRARIPSRQHVRAAEVVGLTFREDRVVVFEVGSGQALRSELFERAA